MSRYIFIAPRVVLDGLASMMAVAMSFSSVYTSELLSSCQQASISAFRRQNTVISSSSMTPGTNPSPLSETRCFTDMNQSPTIDATSQYIATSAGRGRLRVWTENS